MFEKVKRRKVYARFKENIWVADLAEMGLLSSKFNKLNTKSNKLDKKIPDTTTLIHMNQCNMDKQNFEKNWRC